MSSEPFVAVSVSPSVTRSTSSAALADKTEPKVSPPGEPPSAKTHVLKSGATALQTDAPVSGMDVYLVGFHPMKDDPARQMEAHHFCKQLNEDFAQCALFDGNTAHANLTGIEYIISEKLFETLSAEERQRWHPHNYEILSGQLIAPNIPGPVEKELFEGKMNSYGKTWHVWATDQGERLPTGEAMLAWSFNRDVAEGVAGPPEARAHRVIHARGVSHRRAFMTYLETRAMNRQFLEAEAVLFAEGSAVEA